MSQLRAGSEVVHIGFWTDYDRGGRVNGASLTLRNRHAAILLAFLAVLVGLSANRSWKIWRLALLAPFQGLQSRTTRKKELQVILRNSETTGATLWSLLMLPLTTQGAVNGSDRLKTLFAGLLALSHMLAFLVAGILTSQVVVGREVLSKVTPTCGQWISKHSIIKSGFSSNPDGWAASEMLTNLTIDADNYVRNCYPQGISREVLQCDTLNSRYLTFQENHNVECPFAKEICKNGSMAAFELDTGQIPLNLMGINSRFSKDLSFRRRSVCASIYSSPFNTKNLNSSNTPSLSPGERILQYTFMNGTDVPPRVYRFDNYSTGYRLDSLLIPSELYTRSPLLTTRRGASDLSIIIMEALGVQFLQKSDDPWFSVHRTVEYLPGYDRGGWPETYAADYTLNVLGCDEQLQLCSALSNNCTEWQPLQSIKALDAMPLVRPNVKFQSKEYNETFSAFQLVLQSISATALHNSISNRGPAAMQAARYLLETFQYRLEQEQWKTELRYWFSVSLARLQMEIFNTIAKPPELDENLIENFWQTQLPEMLQYCGIIKFRSSDHTTMSALGIGLIVAFAVVLLLGSYTELLVGRFQWGKPFAHRWDQLENLALFHELERIKTD